MRKRNVMIGLAGALALSIGVTGSASAGTLSGCLLYTSDAADDSLRVDLGGRRIIKKIFFSSRRRHTRLTSVSWARRCV